MNRKELIDIIVDENDCTRELADNVLDSIIDTITHEMLLGAKVGIRNFGVFYPRVQKAKKVYNFHTGEVIDMDEHVVPSFKASKGYINELNQIIKISK